MSEPFDCIAPNIKIEVVPTTPMSEFEPQYVLSENFAGLIDPNLCGISSNKDAENVETGSESPEWLNQRAFDKVTGPLDFVHMTGGGRIYRGIGAARGVKAGDIAGLTVAQRRILHWNRMVEKEDEEEDKDKDKKKEQVPLTPKNVKVELPRYCTHLIEQC